MSNENETEQTETEIKRGPGRPRKNPTPEQIAAAEAEKREEARKAFAEVKAAENQPPANMTEIPPYARDVQPRRELTSVPPPANAEAFAQDAPPEGFVDRLPEFMRDVQPKAAAPVKSAVPAFEGDMEELKENAIAFVESTEGVELVRRGNTTRTMLQKAFHAAGLNTGTLEFADQMRSHLAANAKLAKKQNIVELIQNW